jgi:VWFA-related protein
MYRTLFRSIVVALLVATLAIPAAEFRAFAQQQQQPPPKKQEPEQEFAITVEVPVVNVDVVVTDNQGSFVTGLTKENFRILEDGVPQKITNFAPTDAPITIVLLVEFSKLGYEIFASNAMDWAYQFVSNLEKDDWVALVTFDLKTRIEVDFTRNKFAVRDRLARMYFPGFSESNVFDAINEVVDRLQDVKGKKSILLLASGMDTFSKNTLDTTLRRLRQTDVTIFSVGVGRDLVEWLDARGIISSATRIGYLQAENQLSSFARMTGGRAWFPRFQGEIPSIMREVAAMLRNQYSLGYTPTNQKRDGKVRKIKVELVGKDGKPLEIVDQRGKKVKYVIYAREGYVIPKAEVAD